MTFITGVFTGDWKTAWDGVKKIFAGVFGALYSIAKTPLDLIVNLINGVIDGLNSIKIDLPDWAEKLTGYTSFGLNIPHMPKLPALAKGAITNGPMAAWIGDNPGGQEVVSPLSDLMDMIQSAVGTAVMAASQFNNNRQSDVVINLDGIQLARVLSPYTQKENSRIGAPMISSAGSAVIQTT
jgi:phage-related protein